MKKTLLCTALILAAGPALAAGKLNLYNWGDYTSPDMIAKFEKEYDVDVTLTDYDSNDTALAKIQAGGHGFDLVVPSANYIQTFADAGLIAELDKSRLKNFGNIDPKWVDVAWDPGRKYSIPWLWGSTGVGINKSVYSGNPNTSAVFLDVPPELVGKINVVPEMNDVLGLAIMYVGGEPCTEDKEQWRKARDVLMAAKPNWMSMNYGVNEKLASGDMAASVNWNGSTMRARLANPDIVYGYPQEGFPLFMDSVALLSDAENVDNAYLFLDFIMEPENAAMISAFAKYANGIKGSEEFMPDDLKNAPEVIIPAELAGAGKFLPRCSPTAREYMTAIWTELQK
ncbi:extracellular solute-binding protein [Paracoccus pacificus]|uniref:Putrescine-binding periplasmic protein n=1 Tax=Paracoccus pacificus TaxID=1463598 RepID=A0ABW4R6D0_9RHOB